MKTTTQDSENRYLQGEEIRKYLLDITDYMMQKDDILILITRKGYWAYKVLVEKEVQDITREKIKVFSDRYLTKCIDFEPLFPDSNKGTKTKYVIFDDTVNSGVNLFFFYAYLDGVLRENDVDAEIVPMTYALNTEYSFDDENILMIREYQRLCRDRKYVDVEREAKKIITEFNKSLQWKVRLSPENIARIRTYEIDMLQERISPMVVDLPMVSVEVMADGESTIPSYMLDSNNKGIEMSEEQFYNLKKGNSYWEYVENPFKWKDEKVNASFFQFKKREDFFNVEDILHDGIMKCEYRRLENGRVRLVFVPFAIINSMTFSDTVRYFFGLLDDTGYDEIIRKYVKEQIKKLNLSDEESITYHEVAKVMKGNHNLCRNMYRFVIFYLGYFLFLNFKTFVKECAGIEIGFDWDIMKESLPDSFIKSFQKTCKNEKYDCAEFKLRFLMLPKPEKVQPVDLEFSENIQKRESDELSMSLMLNSRLLEGKNSPEKTLRQRVYTIETMVTEFEEAFVFESRESERKMVTKLITAMLETSIYGNEIYVDNEDEVIYRGFRYGENSELLFLPGMEYFYAYVYAYYYYVGSYKYHEYYPVFIKEVKRHFLKENYMGTIISAEVFDFLEKYFGNLEKKKTEELVMNKSFVLDSCGSKEDDNVRAFLNQAFIQVRRWGLVGGRIYEE